MRARQLVDDWNMVRAIARRKRLVRHHLLESASHCRAGVWYVEGPYARHAAARLPDGLRDAIRGIRHRTLAREAVERVTPPWRIRLSGAGSRAQAECTIAYLTNGGNWKLFDLQERRVWTRPMFEGKLERDIATLEFFGRYFKIAPWRVVREGGLSWRLDRLLAGSSMVHAARGDRLAAVNDLIAQYAAFAGEASQSAAPELTERALATIVDCAPASIPARIARRFASEMREFGREFKCLPAHGDLSAQNVIVCDGKAWVLDWDTAGSLQTILYDILYLVVREAALGRTDLLDEFLAGRFQTQVERNLGAFGLSRTRVSGDRLLLLMHGYILYLHAARTGARADAQAANVDAVWNPLRNYCAGYLR